MVCGDSRGPSNQLLWVSSPCVCDIPCAWCLHSNSHTTQLERSHSPWLKSQDNPEKPWWGRGSSGSVAVLLMTILYTFVLLTFTDTHIMLLPCQDDCITCATYILTYILAQLHTYIGMTPHPCHSGKWKFINNFILSKIKSAVLISGIWSTQWSPMNLTLFLRMQEFAHLFAGFYI